MPDQLALFSAEAQEPLGLRFQPDFITADEERELIEQMQKLPLAPFQFGAFEGKRRVVSFGLHYDFTVQKLEAADAIPSWLLPFVDRVEQFGGLQQGDVRHVLCTEYDVGAGIGWHRDKRQFDKVFGLSLGSACKLRFRRRNGAGWQRYALDAQPRSLYMMSDESRRIWEHSIAAVETPRYSITFRTMALTK